MGGRGARTGVWFPRRGCSDVTSAWAEEAAKIVYALAVGGILRVAEVCGYALRVERVDEVLGNVDEREVGVPCAEGAEHEVVPLDHECASREVVRVCVARERRKGADSVPLQT